MADIVAPAFAGPCASGVGAVDGTLRRLPRSWPAPSRIRTLLGGLEAYHDVVSAGDRRAPDNPGQAGVEEPVHQPRGQHRTGAE
jgi:hypothetical protein